MSILYYECYIIPNQIIFIPISDNDNKSYNYNNDRETSCISYKNRINNNISINSKRKLKYAINTLKAISTPKTAYNFKSGKPFKFLLNFLTLTLPAEQGTIKDTYIKRVLLNKFLINAKHKYGLNNYVWKAERQKNDNLHIHITSNTYMNCEWIKHTWNRILSETDLINKFYLKHHHKDPNSTDIHSVRNIKRLDLYLIKYFTKNDNDQKIIAGKLWDCSNSLNFNNRLHFPITDDLRECYSYIIKKYSKLLYENDYYTSISFYNESEFKRLPVELMEKYQHHLEFLRSLS